MCDERDMAVSTVEREIVAQIAIASLFCMSSGEASLPMLCPSSTCEDTGADVASSPELRTKQKLVVLDAR